MSSSMIIQQGNRNHRINFTANTEETILQLLLRNRIPIHHSCGGMGTCGTCAIKVQNGLERFSPRDEIENEWAQDRGCNANERLACQCLPVKDAIIEIPEKTLNQNKS